MRNINKTNKILQDNLIYQKYINWLDTHNGMRPRAQIKRDGKILKRSELTEEERYEVTLYYKWINTYEYASYCNAKGMPIDELTDELQKYKQVIIKLREYENLENKNVKVKKEKTNNPVTKTSNISNKPKKKKLSDEEKELKRIEKEQKVYEDIVKWLETNNGIMPRSQFKRDGERLLFVEEFTEEERYERRLYDRFIISDLKKMLQECIGLSIDEIPKEYEKDKEKIQTLRNYGYGLDSISKRVMKRCVGKCVSTNEETRENLTDLMKNTEKSEDDSQKER